jgi:hypothetical protein
MLGEQSQRWESHTRMVEKIAGGVLGRCKSVTPALG